MPRSRPSAHRILQRRWRRGWELSRRAAACSCSARLGVDMQSIGERFCLSSAVPPQAYSSTVRK